MTERPVGTDPSRERSPGRIPRGPGAGAPTGEAAGGGGDPLSVEGRGAGQGLVKRRLGVGGARSRRQVVVAGLAGWGGGGGVIASAARPRTARSASTDGACNNGFVTQDGATTNVGRKPRGASARAVLHGDAARLEDRLEEEGGHGEGDGGMAAAKLLAVALGARAGHPQEGLAPKDPFNTRNRLKCRSFMLRQILETCPS